MRYQAVFIDLDGTLLNSRHEITGETIDALAKAQCSGVHVVINSGRVTTEASKFMDQIGIRIPLVCANGAFIRFINADGTESDTVVDVLAPAVLPKIIEISMKYDAFLSLYTPYRIYMKTENLELIRSRRPLGPNQIFVGETEWREVLRRHHGEILKGTFLCSDAGQMEAVRGSLEALHMLEVASSATNYIEFNSRGVTKGTGMLAYLKHYNISPAHSVAIGDNENDLPMIESAGLGVAMGNAIELVKQRADHVTRTNDEDGVAAVMRDFVL